MAAQSDKNFSFDDICWLLSRLGFESRQSGSHVVFKKGDAFANVQNLAGKAKSYQVAQVREELKKHNIEPC